MLIQFSVENFLSIKEKIVLSMLASNDTEHPEHLIPSDKKDNCLKSAVIYGANASGKSNVLNAFWFVVNYVLNSHEKQLNKCTDRVPFRFDPATPTEPSRFEVIFAIKGIRYAYGFAATDKEIVEEYLIYYPNGRPARIFERKNVNEYRFTTDIDLQNTLKERNSHNKLYLSTAANWNYEKVKPVFEWFSSCVVMTQKSDFYQIDTEQIGDAQLRQRIVDMLRTADLGIHDLLLQDTMPGIHLSESRISNKNIYAIHQFKNGNEKTKSIALSIEEESDGVKRYISIIDQTLKAIEQGCLLLIDDLDIHLHPLLLRHILSQFHGQENNPNDAQLIFTAHNTTLLDLNFMRRDQIWFTEKDYDTRATDLFSLYAFSIRKDIKVERDYLLGRYGAIPFIK